MLENDVPEQYLGVQPELKQMLELVSDFKTLLRGSDENKLDEWIKKAEDMHVTELDSFLKLIRSDKEAVKMQSDINTVTDQQKDIIIK